MATIYMVQRVSLFRKKILDINTDMTEAINTMDKIATKLGKHSLRIAVAEVNEKGKISREKELIRYQKTKK